MKSRAETNRVLPRDCSGHSKQPLPTTPEMTENLDPTRWSIPKSEWLCFLQAKMEKLYIVSKRNTGSWLWLRSWTTDCQIQTETEEIGKTMREFRYDLHQILYSFTVEVTDRFMGLNLIDRVQEELWTEVRDIAQEAVIKTIPEKETEKSKMIFWGGLPNKWAQKRSERQRRKGKIYPP